MLKRNLSLRVAGPTFFVSLLLLGSCTAVALFLYRQQSTTAEILGENVGSAEVARDLENTLKDLLLVLQAASRDPQSGPGQVDFLHDRVRALLVEAHRLADKEEESKLVNQLDKSFTRYFEAWRVGYHLPTTSGEDKLGAGVKILETETLPICGQLREFNSAQIKESELVHRATVRWMVWGLAGVGVLGSFAGILLGYGVTRGLRQSIYQLSVRVRDAADKLGQELPTVTLTQDDDLHHLQEQLHGMVREIEDVVQRLQQREREVLRAEQMAAVGQVAAGVAHELRNPLTSIKMLVQRIRKQPESQRLSPDNLQIIEQEIRRMERCLQTFLDFARPPKPERHPLNLPSLVERTFRLIDGRAAKQQVTLRFQQSADPVMVEADWEQIQQLLVNLALNALDAMPRGGVLTVEISSSATGQVELRVMDTGCGISPQILPRLFEPFVSGKETGLGLGLVVSRRIAEDHGGTLWAMNRPERGACFVLRLPAVIQSSASSDTDIKETGNAYAAGGR